MVDRQNDHWLWIGGKKAAGYGQFAIKRDGKWTKEVAHRYAYMLWVGPIPEGFEIDHVCKTRSCVRPDHLEAVPLVENRRRRNAHNAYGPDATHCRAGHAYSIRGRHSDGHCAACRSEWKAKRKAS